MGRKKKDFAAMAKERDLQAKAAAAATGSQTAAQPAAPAGVPLAAPPASADRAQTAEEAEFFNGWFAAVFFADPKGALKKFEDRVAQGIEMGHYTIERAEQWIRDPANERAIQTMLALSVPGQSVHAEGLDVLEPAAVIENYMQERFKSANGDLSRLPQIASLSLGGAAAPAPAARVRRASLLPSAAFKL